MARVEGEIVIERAVDEVFDFVADEHNEPRYNPRLRRVEQLAPGAIGTGTRFRAETTMGRRPVPMIIEITGYDRPHRLTSTTSLSTMEIEGTLTFEQVPRGTVMRWRWELRPRGTYKLMSPLMTRMGDRQERAIWGNLKHLLEMDETPAPPRTGSFVAPLAGGVLCSLGLVEAHRLAGGDEADARRTARATGPVRILAGTLMLARPQLLRRVLGSDSSPGEPAWPGRMIAVREIVIGAATLTAGRSRLDARPWLLTLSLIDGAEALVVIDAVRRQEVGRAAGLAFAAADAGSAAAGLGVIAQMRRRRPRRS